MAIKSNGSTVFGDPNVGMQDGSTLEEDKYGLTTGVVTFKWYNANAYQLTPRPGTVHPLYPFLVVERRHFKIGAIYTTARVHYVGMDPEIGTESDPVYSLDFGTGTEPIETHPNFVSKIGGKPSDPDNGAVFRNAEGQKTRDDAEGFFDEFTMMHNGVQNRFAGKEAYLAPTNIVYSKRYTSRVEPTDYSTVGKKDNPEGPAPNYPDRDWLNLGISWTKRGHVYECNKQWKASAPGGLIDEIYVY